MVWVSECLHRNDLARDQGPSEGMTQIPASRRLSGCPPTTAAEHREHADTGASNIHITFHIPSLVFLGKCWPLTLSLCPFLALLVWFFYLLTGFTKAASKQKQHCKASRMPLPLLMVLTWHIYIYCSSTYTQSEYWIEKSHLWALWPFVLLLSGPIPTGLRQKVSQFETWQCIAMLL